MAANRSMIEAVIEGILAQHSSSQGPSSQSYINHLIGKNGQMTGIKKRYTKILLVDRKLAQNPQVVRAWFKDFGHFCFTNG